MPKREREKGDVDQHNNRENERYRDVEREREGEKRNKKYCHWIFSVEEGEQERVSFSRSLSFNAMFGCRLNDLQ